MDNAYKDRPRILLTGANGFIGQFLFRYLQTYSSMTQIPQVITTYRTLPEDMHLSANHFIVGDINRNTQWEKALTDVDIVVHLAARVHVMKETHIDPLRSFREVNVEGTLNLAKQAVGAGVKRFVYLSSIKVNGEKTHNQPFYADDPPNPHDPYAISKLEAEQQLLKLSKETGLEIVIIRPPLVYGPGVKGNFSRLLSLVKKSIPLPFKHIKNQRSLVNVQNLCSLIKICLTHPKASGQVFLVSDGEDLSTSQLITAISKVIGQKQVLFFLPSFLIKFLTYSIGLRSIYDRLFDSLQVNIEKNRRILGWKPTISVEKGILQIFKN